jgi:hypothetical protein
MQKELVLVQFMRRNALLSATMLRLGETGKTTNFLDIIQGLRLIKNWN